MRRTAIALILALSVLGTAGCSWRSKNPAPAQPPVVTQPPAQPGQPTPPQPPAQVPEGPDLAAAQGPWAFSMEQLEAGLRRYLTVNQEPVAIALRNLYTRWNLPVGGDGKILLAEADLDGDGTPETITALNGGGEGAGLTGQGTIFVIRRRDGQVEVTRKAGEDPGVALHGVADLTGDGKPEIVYSSTEAGAHTAFSRVLVATYADGHLLVLEGTISMASMRASVEGKEIVLTGGMIGSVGAGEAQRERQERYRWTDGAFRLVDRRFSPTDYGYHLLIDGITAEQFGRLNDARTALAAAAEAGRQAGPASWLNPESGGSFPDAVRAFARLRLAALHLGQGQKAEAQQVIAAASGRYAGLVQAMSGAADRNAACQAAQAWARQNPAFLESLHSVMGYANPEWRAQDLCGPLPLNQP